MTGKGGVGRTTIAAGLAVAAAQLGRRVLLTEIGEPDGDYSPLARLFGRDNLPELPEEIGSGVSACVLHARLGHEAFLADVLPVPALVKAGMRSKALRRFLDMAPSFKEMGVFNYLLTLLKERDREGGYAHELVIVDMPATGHTLALTGLPETLLQIVPVGPVAEALREGQEILNNPATGAACVVTLPETLPVTESLELIEGLRETNMPIGAALVNKIMTDRFSEAERDALMPIVEAHPVYGRSRFLSQIDNRQAVVRLKRNANVPIAIIPEYTETGTELLERIAAALIYAHKTTRA